MGAFLRAPDQSSHLLRPRRRGAFRPGGDRGRATDGICLAGNMAGGAAERGVSGMARSTQRVIRAVAGRAVSEKAIECGRPCWARVARPPCPCPTNPWRVGHVRRANRLATALSPAISCPANDSNVAWIDLLTLDRFRVFVTG